MSRLKEIYRMLSVSNRIAKTAIDIKEEDLRNKVMMAEDKRSHELRQVYSKAFGDKGYVVKRIISGDSAIDKKTLEILPKVSSLARVSVSEQDIARNSGKVLIDGSWVAFPSSAVRVSFRSMLSQIFLRLMNYADSNYSEDEKMDFRKKSIQVKEIIKNNFIQRADRMLNFNIDSEKIIENESLIRVQKSKADLALMGIPSDIVPLQVYSIINNFRDICEDEVKLFEERILLIKEISQDLEGLARKRKDDLFVIISSVANDIATMSYKDEDCGTMWTSCKDIKTEAYQSEGVYDAISYGGITCYLVRAESESEAYPVNRPIGRINLVMFKPKSASSYKLIPDTEKQYGFHEDVPEFKNIVRDFAEGFNNSFCNSSSPHKLVGDQNPDMDKTMVSGKNLSKDDFEIKNDYSSVELFETESDRSKFWSDEMEWLFEIESEVSIYGSDKFKDMIKYLIVNAPTLYPSSENYFKDFREKMSSDRSFRIIRSHVVNSDYDKDLKAAIMELDLDVYLNNVLSFLYAIFGRQYDVIEIFRSSGLYKKIPELEAKIYEAALSNEVSNLDIAREYNEYLSYGVMPSDIKNDGKRISSILEKITSEVIRVSDKFLRTKDLSDNEYEVYENFSEEKTRNYGSNAILFMMISYSGIKDGEIFLENGKVTYSGNGLFSKKLNKLNSTNFGGRQFSELVKDYEQIIIKHISEEHFRRFVSAVISM